jgi:hypothetical protein
MQKYAINMQKYDLWDMKSHVNRLKRYIQDFIAVVQEIKNLKQALGPSLLCQRAVPAAAWPRAVPTAAMAEHSPGRRLQSPSKTAIRGHGIKIRSMHKNELSVPESSRNLI